MSFAKSPLRREPNGRTAHTRFVEVEMPEVAARPLVIEMECGGRILLSEPVHVALVRALNWLCRGFHVGLTHFTVFGWIVPSLRVLHLILQRENQLLEAARFPFLGYCCCASGR